MSAFYSTSPQPFRRSVYPHKRGREVMGNSKFRCGTCKQYVDIDDAYLTLAVGRFCSSECVAAKLGQKKAKARSSAKRAKGRAAGTGVARPKTIPLEVRAAVRVRDKRCRMCGGNGTQVHHIRFRSQGGSDTEDNLILLCNGCHHLHAHGELARYWRQVFRAVIWMQVVEGRRRTALETARWLAATGVLEAPVSCRPAS